MTPVDSAVGLHGLDDRREAETLLAAMDRAGIALSLLAPPDAQAAVFNAEGNAALRRLAEQRPARFAWLAAANPWFGARALDELVAAFAAGARGLYLHPQRQGFALTEPVLRPLLDCCAAAGKPVYSVTGMPVCAEPFQLAELARAYPGMAFVMGRAAHSDYWYDVIPAARQAPNLLVETSCAAPSLVRAMLDALGPARLLFGSGTPVSALDLELRKLDLVGLSSAERAAVLDTNARRTWSLA